MTNDVEKNKIETSLVGSKARTTVAFEHALAGIGAGATATLVLHPLDLIKIRFQVSGMTTIPQKFSYNGTLDAFHKIWSLEGLKGFYRGLSANIIGSTVSWGSYFFWYEILKRQLLENRTSRSKLGPLDHMSAAAIAGTLTALMTNPIWVIKTRMCADSVHTPKDRKYRGVFHGLVQIATQEGFRGWYKGFVPSLFGVSHGMFQFMAYEELKSFLYSYHELDETHKLSDGEYLLMGATSKIFATVITYPYQVLRSRLQNQREFKSHPYYGDVSKVLRQIWQYEGLKGFYRGLTPTVIRVTPASCIIFIVYERLLKLTQNLSSSTRG